MKRIKMLLQLKIRVTAPIRHGMIGDINNESLTHYTTKIN